jgi:3',5'-cyclic-AMP phosphodiesterase
MNSSRRSFLATSSTLLAGSSLTVEGQRTPSPGAFSFIHFNDLHIQPELRAAEGCRQCVSRMNRVQADFAIAGGDLVFDAAEVELPRAQKLFDLYRETLKPFETKVYSVLGNHDVFGVSSKSGIPGSDPNYGKKMFEERIGPRYQSFDHKGWHFVLLDSIGTKPNGRDFVGHIDAPQLEWLKADLAKLRAGSPLIVCTHVPLVSGVMQLVADPWKNAETYLVTNAREVLEILWPYKPKAVFQGHTHIRESLTYNGCQFITSGAVCGNWWKGPREGHPEGFGVVTVGKDGSVIWRYETYGFKAVSA